MLAKAQEIITSAIAEGKALVVKIYGMCYAFAVKVVNQLRDLINFRKAV